MPFEFINDLRWLGLDDDAKKGMLGIAFGDEIASDDRWVDLPAETQQAMKSAYFQKAEEYEQRLRDEEAGKPLGFLKGTASAVGGGFVDIAEMYSRAGRAMPGGAEAGVGEGISGTVLGGIEKVREKYPLLAERETGGVKGALYGGLRSAVTSLGARAPGAAAGAALGAAVSGPAAPAGALIGGAAGFLLGGPLFGMAEYDSAMEEGLTSNRYKEGQITKDEIEAFAIRSAAHETGWEFVSDALTIATMGGGMAVGIAGKEALKQSVKDTLKSSGKQVGKRMAVISGAETSTELVTAGFQTEERRKLGLTDATFLEGAKRAFGPAFVASLIFGGIGEGGIKLKRTKTLHDLEDSSVDPLIRQNAVNEVANAISSVSPEIAQTWKGYADQAIANKESITTDERLIDATAKPHENKSESAIAANNIIATGLQTGEFNGQAFTPAHAISLMEQGRRDGILSDADIKQIEEQYSDLLGGKRAAVADIGVAETVDEAIAAFNKSTSLGEVYAKARERVGLLTPQQETERAFDVYQPTVPGLLTPSPSPGVPAPAWTGPSSIYELQEGVKERQGRISDAERMFETYQPELPPAKPEVRLRKAPPTYPVGAEYVAGKEAPESLEVEHKPIVRPNGKPWKTMYAAESALKKSERLKSIGISVRTHKIVEAPGGGYQLVRYGDKGIAQKREIKKKAKGKTLIAFVRSMGGIKDTTLPGEVRALSSKETGVVGLTAKRIDRGLGFDEMAAAAAEHGWLPEGLEDQTGAFSKLLQDDIFAQKEGKQRVERQEDIAEKTEIEERWKEFEQSEDEELEYFAKHPDEIANSDLDQWQREAVEEIRRQNDADSAREIEESVKSEVEAEDGRLGEAQKELGFQEFSDLYDEKDLLDEEAFAELEAWRAGKDDVPEPAEVVEKLAEYSKKVKAETPEMLKESDRVNDVTLGALVDIAAEDPKKAMEHAEESTVSKAKLIEGLKNKGLKAMGEAKSKDERAEIKKNLEETLRGIEEGKPAGQRVAEAKEFVRGVTIQEEIRDIVSEQQQQIKKLEDEVEDWEGRVYKKSSKKALVGSDEEQGDTPWEPGVKKIGVDYINEKRRRVAISDIKDQVAEIEDTIKSLDKLSNEIESGNDIKPAGVKEGFGEYQAAFLHLYEKRGGKRDAHGFPLDTKAYYDLIEEAQKTAKAPRKPLSKEEEEVFADLLLGITDKPAESLSETKSRLLENIKSEKGSSELINDLSRLGADVIRRGHTSFKAFSAEMRTVLGDAWAKVKDLMRKAYFGAKGVLKGERGAWTIKADQEQTKSPAFKKWFKDSKVVNKDRSPLLAYHGTNDKITIFDYKKRGVKTGASSAKKAFFFTDNKYTARHYVEPLTLGGKKEKKYIEFVNNNKRIYTKNDLVLKKNPDTKLANFQYEGGNIYDHGENDYVKIKEKIIEEFEILNSEVGERLSKSNFVKEQDHVKANNILKIVLSKYYPESVYTGETTSGGRYVNVASCALTDESKRIAILKANNKFGIESIVGSFYLSIKNPLVYVFRGGDAAGTISKIVDKAIENGNDGVIFKNVDDGGPISAHYAVFNPTQIKSATGNIGTFSETDPSILKEPEAPYASEPYMYSALTRAAESPKFPEKLPAKSVINRLKKALGVKQAEIDTVGLSEWLDGKEKVSKAELVEFLRLMESVGRYRLYGKELWDTSKDVWRKNVEKDIVGEISKLEKDGLYDEIGIRTTDNPENLTSRIWVDGETTGEILSGVSATTADKHWRDAHLYKKSTGSGYYFGNYIQILASNSAESGEDIGEVVLHDPVVIKTYVSPNAWDAALIKSASAQHKLSETDLAFGGKKKADEAIESVARKVEAVSLSRRGMPDRVAGISKSRVAKKLRKKGRIDLVGSKLTEGNESQEIAELFQVYRSPKMEIFHAIYTDADGNVLGHRPVTSGSLDSVKPGKIFKRYLVGIDSAAKRLGATKIHFLHNHPSGNPEMSIDDILIANDTSNYFEGRMGEFVVINHGKFSFVKKGVLGKGQTARQIQNAFSWDKTVDDFTWQDTYKIQDTGEWIDKKGPVLTSPQAAASFGRSLAYDKTKVCFVYADTGNNVVGWSVHDNKILKKDIPDLEKIMRQQAKGHNASKAIIIADDMVLLEPIVASKNLGDWLLDVQNTKGESLGEVLPSAFGVIEKPTKLARGLFEPKTEYGKKKDVALIRELNNALALQLKDKEWKDAYIQAGNLSQSDVDVIKAFEKGYKTRVVPIQPKEGKKEVTRPGGLTFKGTIFVNTDAPIGFIQLAGHELLHKIKQEDKKSYDTFRATARDYFRNFKDYEYTQRETLLAGESALSLAELEEELLADFTGDALADAEFLKYMAGEDASIFKKFVKAALRWLKNISSKLSREGFGSSRYFKDVNRLREYLDVVLHDFAERENVDDIKDIGKIKFARVEEQDLDAWAKSVISEIKKTDTAYVEIPEVYNVIHEKFGTTTAKSVKDKLVDATDDFRENWQTRLLDRLHPIKAHFGEDDTYMLHRLETGVQAPVAMFMRHGIPEWDGKAITVKTTDQGFLPWFKNLGEDAHNFLYWVAAKRAEQLDAEGREHWLDKSARTAILKEVGKTDKHWNDINKEFQKFNKGILNLAEGSGLIDPAKRAVWEQEFYVPFYRIFEDDVAREEFLKAPLRSKKHISAQIKRLVGAEKKLGDPLENILRNWTHLIHESMRNQSRAEAFRSASQTNLKSSMVGQDGYPLPLIEKIGKNKLNIYRKGKDGKTVYVYEKAEVPVLSFQDNGKTVYIKINDAELYNAMSNLNTQAFNNIAMRIFGSAKRALTYGATFGPAFRIANMLRDTMHTAIIAKSFTPFMDSAIGFVKSMRENQDYVKLMASGAGFGSSYVRAEDPKALTKYIDSIVKREGVDAKNRILDTPKKLLHMWEKIGSASENAARVQLYANLRKEGTVHLEASFKSRDLLDFTMRGDSGVVQFLIQTVPFMNARTQGLYRLGRAVHHDPKLFALKGSMITLASLALWAFNQDKDEWKELEDWEKWTYYHFWIGDKHYRIPKPFEVGTIFSSMFESVADVMAGNDEIDHLVNFSKHAALETFAMNPLPQAVKPLAEQWANKSFFTDRPIVGQGIERLIPGEQYEAWTSETLRVMGKALNISPKRAEAFINGYFSTIGVLFLGASDVLVRQALDFPSEPTKKVDDYPLVGRFMREKENPRHTKYMTKFYEFFNEVDRLSATVNKYRQTGKYEEARALALKERKKLIARTRLAGVKTQVRAINKNIRRILLDTKLSSSKKRQMVDRLVGRRNVVVKKAYKQIHR